jgi:predicted glycogen debranching enzyme
MLPNFFPESGQAAEFNAVDASLWYIVAVHELREALDRNGSRLEDDEESALDRAVQQILSGYAGGTRFGIRLDDDGLLAAGEPGVQLTWMDAKVGDWVVTPRIGKPVEVQALWINALRIGAASEPRWRALHTQALASFTTRFWDEGRGTLADVVDVDHVRGRIDVSVRPNQIFAVGGLPYSMLRGAAARAVVDAVEQHLLTPLGLRSLAPGEAGYAARYEGGVLQRDGSYHQGTVWPWLIGPFVEAWLRVHGDSPASRQVARQRFLVPLLAHLEVAGLGHVSEIADAEFPHTPRGCPFQAWSVGELLRLSDRILSESGSAQFSELEATAAV